MNCVKRFIYNIGIPVIGKFFVKRNRFVNVIYYHDIVEGEGRSFMQTNYGLFASQMHYIASNGYETLTFDDLNTSSNLCYKKKRILIAFDDGWVSNYTEIYELMKSLDLKYNIFLTVKEIGNNPDYLTWEQVVKLHNDGICGFGVHTYTHPNMSDLSKINPNIEFSKADEIFKENLGYYPEDFCYPFGYYSEESNEDISHNQRYIRIYTSDYMYSYIQNEKIIFGRSGISNDETFGVFKAKLNGCFNVWNLLLRK